MATGTRAAGGSRRCGRNASRRLSWGRDQRASWSRAGARRHRDGLRIAAAALRTAPADAGERDALEVGLAQQPTQFVDARTRGTASGGGPAAGAPPARDASAPSQPRSRGPPAATGSAPARGGTRQRMRTRADRFRRVRAQSGAAGGPARAARPRASERQQPLEQIGILLWRRGCRVGGSGQMHCPSPRITMCSGRLGGSDQPRRSATASVRATASSGVRVPASPPFCERKRLLFLSHAAIDSEMGATSREWKRAEQDGDGQRESFCAIVRQTTANVDSSGARIAARAPSACDAVYTLCPNTKSRNAAGTWKLGPPVGDHAAWMTSSCGRAGPRGRLMRYRLKRHLSPGFGGSWRATAARGIPATAAGLSPSIRQGRRARPGTARRGSRLRQSPTPDPSAARATASRRRGRRTR